MQLTYGLQHSMVILASVSIERLINSLWVGRSKIWQATNRLSACTQYSLCVVRSRFTQNFCGFYFRSKMHMRNTQKLAPYENFPYTVVSVNVDGLQNWFMVYNNASWITESDVQSAVFRMSLIETPLSKATETAVALVESAVNSVNTPALVNVSLSHCAIMPPWLGWLDDVFIDRYM